MTPSWRNVGTGLRLMQIGGQVIGYSLAASVVIGCGALFVVAASDGDELAGWVALSLVFSTLGAVLVGRLLCAVGRWFCLATPPDAAKARARIRLAVIFETCSLFGGATYALCSCYWTLVPLEVGLGSFGFWLLTAVLGRVCFFWFVRAVAESLPLPTVLDNAKLLARLSVATLVAAVLGALLLAVGDRIHASVEELLPLKVFTTILGCVFLFIAVAFFLYLFVSHFLLIGELRTALAAHTPEPSDADPDAAYRERYLAGGGSVADA